MAKETYADAQGRIFRDLGGKGWVLSSPLLKVRHATSQDGRIRLWFKTQSIYFTILENGAKTHNLSKGLSIHLDPREETVVGVLARVVRFVDTIEKEGR